jgi:hypothetical protein
MLSCWGGGGIECDPPPGRVVMVGPSHTFAQLAEAINAAFARWDLSHLHEFELPDGQLVGYPDDSFEPDAVWLDHAKLKVARKLKPGMEFSYVFDLGDNWRHRCRVQEAKVDPIEAYGAVPSGPVPIWGWDRSRISTVVARGTAAMRTRDTRLGLGCPHGGRSIEIHDG